MRELTIFELNLVSGSKGDSNKASYTDGINIGVGIGGGIASMPKGVSADQIARGAARGGMLGLAGVIGWNIGTHLYEETVIGTVINKGTDKLIDYQMNKQQSQTKDKSGNNYGH